MLIYKLLIRQNLGGGGGAKNPSPENVESLGYNHEIGHCFHLKLKLKKVFLFPNKSMAFFLNPGYFLVSRGH